MAVRKIYKLASSGQLGCVIRNLFVLVGVALALTMTGCGKVPTWNELTSEEKEKKEAAAEPEIDVYANQQKAQTTPAPAAAATQAQQQPAAASPQQLIQTFMKTPTYERSDAQLIALGKLADGLDAFTEMDLSAARSLSAAGLNELTKFPNIKVLKLDGVAIQGADFAGISKLTTLEVFGAEKSGFDATSMQFLAGLTNLKVLNLAETAITDQSFIHLQKLKQLEFINVSKNQLIHGLGFEALKNAPLKSVIAQGTRFGVGGFKFIVGHKQLEELNLGSAQVSDAGLVALKRCKNLQRLSLGFNRLGDLGAKNLAPLTNLTHLNLKNTLAISDRGLEFFKRMKKLQSLNLEGTACSVGGAEKLRKLLDSCTISVQGKVLKGDKV